MSATNALTIQNRNRFIARTGVNEEIWSVAAAAAVDAGLATYLIMRKRRRNLAQGARGSANLCDPEGL